MLSRNTIIISLFTLIGFIFIVYVMRTFVKDDPEWVGEEMEVDEKHEGTSRASKPTERYANAPDDSAAHEQTSDPDDRHQAVVASEEVQSESSHSGQSGISGTLYESRMFVMKLFDAVFKRNPTDKELEKYQNLTKAEILKRFQKDYPLQEGFQSAMASFDSIAEKLTMDVKNSFQTTSKDSGEQGAQVCLSKTDLKHKLKTLTDAVQDLSRYVG